MPLDPEASPPLERRRRGDAAFMVRLRSAAVLAPAAILVAWIGGWVFAAAVAIVSILMMREWIRMSDPIAPARAWLPVGLIAAFAILLAAVDMWLWAGVLLAAGAALAAMLRRPRGHEWRAAFGALYIGVPCMVLLWVRLAPEQGFVALLCLFAIVWAADIGAYIAGAWIGGPKLAPRASPNKTWTGFIVAVALAAVAGGAGFLLIGHSVFIGAVLGLLTGLAAMGGDLLESVLKRRFGVKDAGGIIPGHGGVLDRVDALMGAVLMFAALIAYWPAAGAGFFGG